MTNKKQIQGKHRKEQLPNKAFENKLKAVVGKANVSTSREDIICYSYDATQSIFEPQWVVWAETTYQISQIMKLANEYNVPVTPRGSGTGFSGGALPVKAGIILSLVRMNRIISIDPENLFAEVEPGVITADIDRAAGKYGLFYPPDPASLETSTIGGNVAESAGGPRAVKYGVTRDYVLGVEAVLPTGEIIQTGSRTTKCVVGYDLTRLLVGSEGTLAVFTKIFLKLVPKPEASGTLLALFRDVSTAAKSVSAIIARKIIPTTLEFMDKATIDCVRGYTNDDIPTETGALLLIEIDGAKETVLRQKEHVVEICKKLGAISIKTAQNEEQRTRLWSARRAISPALHQLGPDKYNEDIVVPRSKVPHILKNIDEISKKFSLHIINFGHAGDGNIHVNIMTDNSIVGIKDKVEQAIQEIFRSTIELGGTLSGEHGIGITKAPFLSIELNSATINAMRAIKKALDPKNILNPGKIF